MIFEFQISNASEPMKPERRREEPPVVSCSAGRVSPRRFLGVVTMFPNQKEITARLFPAPPPNQSPEPTSGLRPAAAHL